MFSHSRMLTFNKSCASLKYFPIFFLEKFVILHEGYTIFLLEERRPRGVYVLGGIIGVMLRAEQWAGHGGGSGIVVNWIPNGQFWKKEKKLSFHFFLIGFSFLFDFRFTTTVWESISVEKRADHNFFQCFWKGCFVF